MKQKTKKKDISIRISMRESIYVVYYCTNTYRHGKEM